MSKSRVETKKWNSEKYIKMERNKLELIIILTFFQALNNLKEPDGGGKKFKTCRTRLL